MLFDESRRRIGKREKTLMYTEQKGRCMYCGAKRQVPEFDIDHRTPRARGGSDAMSNLQLLCRPCNTRKGSITDGEFRRRNKLPTVRGSNGPPTKVIPQTHFEDRTKDAAKRRAKSRANDPWGGLLD